MVCVHVCMCAFVRSFFPPLSSQWHWEPSELLHRFGQAKDKNNRAQWKRAQQQGRLSLSPLSVLHASSVTMATVNGHLSFCLSISYSLFLLLLPLIVTPCKLKALHSDWNEEENKRTPHSCLPLAFFKPTLYHRVFVLMAILETLYAGPFYLLFVWHLAGAPQGEGRSVAVAQMKGYQSLNHYINKSTSDCILLFGVALNGILCDCSCYSFFLLLLLTSLWC